MRPEKIYKNILTGSKNVSFTDFVKLLNAFGFELDRVKGSHNIFRHNEVKELINIQNVGGQVKPYQIFQFLSIVENYNLIIKKDK